MKKKNRKWKAVWPGLCLAALCLVSCGSKSTGGFRSDVPVVQLRDAVAGTLGEAYWPEMRLEGEDAAGFLGLPEGCWAEAVVELPMISTQVDTLAIVKAEEGKAEEATEAVTRYQEALMDDTMQYPMNLGKIQASQITVFGDYICFFQLGADTTAQEEQGEEAVIEKCRADNESAAQAVEAELAGQ